MQYLNFHAGTLLLVFVGAEDFTGESEEEEPLPGERVPFVGAAPLKDGAG